MNKNTGLISFFLLGMLGLAALACSSLIFITTHGLQDAQAVLVSKRERGKAISDSFTRFLSGAGDTPMCFESGNAAQLEMCGKKSSEKSPLIRLSHELLESNTTKLHQQQRWLARQSAENVQKRI